MYQAGDTDRNTLVNYAAPLQLFKDDCIRVTGISQPPIEYQNAFGATLSAAAINANSVTKIDCSEALNPAIKTVEVEDTKLNYTIKMTLHKVEFSDKNTRAYLTVENFDPSEDITFYDFNSRAIQGKSQFTTTNSYEINYPKIESTIPPGIVESGVVLFEPLDTTQGEAQFRFEATQGMDNVEFTFDVIISPIEYYDKVLASNSNDTVALINKGLALYELGNYTEAMEYYDKALAIDPHHPLALENKDILLNQLNNR